MLIQTQDIINLLRDYQESHPINHYNEYVYQQSKIENDLIRKLITMIRDLESKGSRA